MVQPPGEKLEKFDGQIMFSTEEAGEYLGITKYTVGHHVRSGNLEPDERNPDAHGFSRQTLYKFFFSGKMRKKES
jgi:hypothetical protein